MPQNDVSVDEGPRIRWLSHKIMILKYDILLPPTVLQLPTEFSTVTRCTGL